LILVFAAICGIEGQGSASILGTRGENQNIEEAKSGGCGFQGKTSKLRTTSTTGNYGM